MTTSSKTPNQGAWWALKLLSFIASSMSLILLINYGIHGNEWAPLTKLAIEFWDGFLNILLTKIIPLASAIKWGLGKFVHYLGLSEVPQLHPQWKHVFVLLMVIYSSFLRGLFQERDFVFLAYALFVSIICSLIAATIAGLITPNSEDLVSNFAVAAMPALLLWLSIYLVWLPRGGLGPHDFRDLLARSILTLLTLAVGVYSAIRIFKLNAHLNVGILGLIGVVIYVAINRVVHGYLRSRRSGIPFPNDPLTRRGLTILQGFGGALAFIILNAFLKLGE